MPKKFVEGKVGARPVKRKSVAAQAPNAPAKHPNQRGRRTTAQPLKSRSRVAPAAGKSESDAAPGKADTLLTEVREIKTMIQQLLPHPSAHDADLDGAVHSLRRLLSEVIEERLEAVLRDLVDLRGEVSVSTEPARVLDRLDELLGKLGAIRFDAVTFDLVDPLIHVVSEERQRADAPDGVILSALRPGYRTGRGIVLCKAAVAVNRQA